MTQTDAANADRRGDMAGADTAVRDTAFGGHGGDTAGTAATAATTATASLSLRDQVAHFVLFELAWFACVLGAAHGQGWIGTAATAAVIAWHLHRARDPGAEARLVGAVLLVGLAVETVMRGTHAIHYVGAPAGAWLPPHWLLALWALFAVVLNVSLRWLKGRWWLAALLGAVFAPLSFAGGVRLGAAEFSDRPLAMLCLAACWAVAMPLMVWLGQCHDGMVAAGRTPGPVRATSTPRTTDTGAQGGAVASAGAAGIAPLAGADV